MNLTTVSDRMYMNYEFYIKQPMQKFELNLNEVFFENQHLVDALDSCIIPSLNKKGSFIPFN